MELLCPVGNFNSLKAAVQNGADAVYFGGADFNARRFAENIMDVGEAVSYAHLRGCKVYFTLNTLLLDRELEAWTAAAQNAIRAGVDAFILQDLGGADVLRQICPDVPRHASTQMNVHNTDTAKALKQCGFSRIILARELSAAQVRQIKSDANIEVEVFAHGALCVSYSGQCLMSSMLGGRSANRGSCAQPCRLPYSYEDKHGYLLSTKDLCLLDHIDLLRDAGVDCIKIEGRMKRPEYVAAVTRAYRKAIDGVAIQQETREIVSLVFNRGGFTGGLFAGDPNRLYPTRPDHIGIPGGKILKTSHNSITVQSQLIFSPGDNIAPSEPDAQATKILQVRQDDRVQHLTLNNASAFRLGSNFDLVMRAGLAQELQQAVSINNVCTPLSAKACIRLDQPSTLEVTAPDGATAKVYGEFAQDAQLLSLTADDVRAQLKKMGGSPFTMAYLEIELDEGAYLSKSALNELRRQALKVLSETILDKSRKWNTTAFTPRKPAARTTNPKRRLAAYARTEEQAQALAGLVDLLYIPADAPFATASLSDHATVGVFPLVTYDDELATLKQQASIFDTVLVESLLDTQQPKIGGRGLNVTNSETLAFLSELGFTRATLSTELNTAQIKDLSVPAGLETEVIVYGRSTLMTTAHCPLHCDGTHCAVQQGGVYLQDRKGMRFPLICAGAGCRVSILNALPLFMADQLDAIRADVLRLDFTIETGEQCARVARLYRRALDGEQNITLEEEYTRGHFNRGLGVKDEN